MLAMLALLASGLRPLYRDLIFLGLENAHDRWTNLVSIVQTDDKIDVVVVDGSSF